MAYKILAINPGSTSTKIALFEGDQEIFKKNVVHEAVDLAKYATVADQLDYRVNTILSVCSEQGVDLASCDAFVGRGGGLNSCPGGTYEVNETMLAHAKRGGGNHPASLGCQIAQKFASQYGKRAFIVNAPDTDEFQDVARVTGLHDVFRTVSIHALNQKETAIRVAKDLGKTYETANFIVCHIGGGVSITAHCQGKMIDSNGIINGEGPMAPTRSGALPAVDLMDLCYSGKWTRDEMYKRITKSGGFVDHLGTSDAIEVNEMIAKGDKYAKLIYDAFQYQIAKEIGATTRAWWPISPSRWAGSPPSKSGPASLKWRPWPPAAAASWPARSRPRYTPARRCSPISTISSSNMFSPMRSGSQAAPTPLS